jgi:hypothetical protein
MVEVFKTNVQKEGEALLIVQQLHSHFPSDRINFDLDDCEKILRVEGHNIQTRNIVQFLMEQGYHCEVLD